MIEWRWNVNSASRYFESKLLVFFPRLFRRNVYVWSCGRGASSCPRGVSNCAIGWWRQGEEIFACLGHMINELILIITYTSDMFGSSTVYSQKTLTRWNLKRWRWRWRQERGRRRSASTVTDKNLAEPALHTKLLIRRHPRMINDKNIPNLTPLDSYCLRVGPTKATALIATNIHRLKSSQPPRFIVQRYSAFYFKGDGRNTIHISLLLGRKLNLKWNLKLPFSLWYMAVFVLLILRAGAIEHPEHSALPRRPRARNHNWPTT